MEMTSLEPAVTQVPLGPPRMPCSSRVDEIGSKNADQAHTYTHTRTHLLYSPTETYCTFLHSGINNRIQKKKTKVHLTSFCCISFTTNVASVHLR